MTNKKRKKQLIDYEELNNKFKGKEGIVFRYELETEDPRLNELEKNYILKYMRKQPLDKLRKLVHILEINNCG